MSGQESYYKYWGKARTELEIDYQSGELNEAAICTKYKLSLEQLNRKVQRHRWEKIGQGEGLVSYHLLPYHCLDVAAVADSWWEVDPALQSLFSSDASYSLQQLKAWLLFFIALHDYGKLDIRFQLKASHAMREVYPDFDPDLVAVSGPYFHGPAGYSLFYFDFQALMGWSEYDTERWDRWSPWLAAVTGHHGEVPDYPSSEILLDESCDADSSIIEHDKAARVRWVYTLELLFLKPAGLSIEDLPPSFNPLITGYCSVADWLGSNSEEGFYFLSQQQALDVYYESRLPIAETLLKKSGLIAAKQPFKSVVDLLPDEYGVEPRQLQTLVTQFPVEQGLTLIEAPTGSGKTETALAYAWRILDAGLADSIIFALPTQATANAMLTRLETIAPILFQDHPNLVLAHGKSTFNDQFWKIQQNYFANTPQDENEAKVQCAQWLSSSRKRVFLGQIGVCTIDQVLVSVLPMRHKFVRGFGIGKSVLIVDEVHAYDSYMYGLLGEVLRQQREMGGSALLLSATLPYHQRSALVKCWQGDLLANRREPYPLVTNVNREGKITPYKLDNDDLPEERIVGIEVQEKPDLLADDELIEQMLQAAEQGAQVVFICNLVDVAQQTAKRLRQQQRVTVDLFHARYRFCDRQAIEASILETYGKEGERQQGRILIATQVVEQSLDLDFDWMITQLCPIDLLFQRMGRLHRHPRQRPSGFEQPRCTVLIPDDEDYGLHELIYGNTRVLWRTAQMLLKAERKIVFPDAYRKWIEKVYQEEVWGDEPPEVITSFEKYSNESSAAAYCAAQMMKSKVSEFSDTDSNVSVLTRDGEMNLNLLPVVEICNGVTLLDGQSIQNIDAWWKDEQINLNLVSVPLKSWSRFLTVGDGLTQLPLIQTDIGWEGNFKGVTVRYSKAYGLEKEDCSA